MDSDEDREASAFKQNIFFLSKISLGYFWKQSLVCEMLDLKAKPVDTI